MVAEVDVNQDTGRVTVTRMVIANDCGPISNPDGLRNQLEGGALQGMSRALLEEVVWDDQKVTSVDWRTYRPLYLGADLPTIETVLINQPDARATGAGETAVTVAVGAIANAIFDATGARVRQAPFTPERVKAALDSRGRYPGAVRIVVPGFGTDCRRHTTPAPSFSRTGLRSEGDSPYARRVSGGAGHFRPLAKQVFVHIHERRRCHRNADECAHEAGEETGAGDNRQHNHEPEHRPPMTVYDLAAHLHGGPEVHPSCR